MKLTLKESEIDHLRSLLEWARTEFFVDTNANNAMVDVIGGVVATGVISAEQASKEMAQRAEQVRQVPDYVRQGIKMLGQAVQAHDAQHRQVVDVEPADEGQKDLSPAQIALVAAVDKETRPALIGYLRSGVDVVVFRQTECGDDVPPFAIALASDHSFWIDCCDTEEQANKRAVELGLRVIPIRNKGEPQHA